MKEWQNEYFKMIDDCEKRESMLSEWDCSFIESIRDKLEHEKPLSSKQIEKLDEIWEKATSRG